MADLSIQREGGQHVTPLLRVERIVDGEVVILRAKGEIDLTTAPVLAEQFAQEEVQVGAALVVDLTEVTFLASAGLGLLAEQSQRHSALGGRLVVVAAHRVVFRAIEITGLTGIVTVVTSIDEALGR